MNLVDVYIQEVTRRLPEKTREDIALELRSTIEDMLPESHNEEDVKTVLQKMGNPAALASGYRDRPMHLIGPRYYDAYITLLKMVLPIAALVTFISVLVEYISGFTGEKAILLAVMEITGYGIWRVIEVLIQTFFWMTVVFAVVERVEKDKHGQPLTLSLQEWTPDELKNITYIPKQKAISKSEVFLGLSWTAIWATLYFYANQLFGIYEGGGESLTLVTPALDQDILLQYWPLAIALIVFEVAFTLYKFIIGQWTKSVAIINAIHEWTSTLIFSIILLTPNLFTPEFTKYKTGIEHLDTWLISITIIVFIVFSVINTIDGFRKAK